LHEQTANPAPVKFGAHIEAPYLGDMRQFDA